MCLNTSLLQWRQIHQAICHWTGIVRPMVSVIWPKFQNISHDTEIRLSSLQPLKRQSRRAVASHRRGHLHIPVTVHDWGQKCTFCVGGRHFPGRQPCARGAGNTERLCLQVCTEKHVLPRGASSWNTSLQHPHLNSQLFSIKAAVFPQRNYPIWDCRSRTLTPFSDKVETTSGELSVAVPTAAGVQ